jgi:tetratricopeptide (TPR) repeat protein
MESRWQLDFVGRAAAKGPRIASVVLILLLVCSSLPAHSQNSPPTDRTTRLKQLFEAGRWNQLVKEVESEPARGPEVAYYYGSALAHLGRWNDARTALLAGRRLSPGDERFPVELGGVAFKQRRYAEAARWLREAVRLAPQDTYADDFLATVYFLEGNTEAALKYWNRIAKPHVEQVRMEPGLRVDPALLDRAFSFAPASTLRLPDFLTTEARVEGLGIFTGPSWHLDALAGGDFNVAFHAQERNSWGDGKWEGLLSTFRGVFYQTAYPEYFNWRGSAVNLTSLVRWDSQKRRLLASLSGPLAQNPQYRYQFGIDLRNENWDLRQSAEGPAPVLGALNLRRAAVSGTLTSLTSGRWNWLAGAEISYRDDRNVFLGPSLPPQVLLGGFQLKQMTRLNYVLARVPERRFEITTSGTSDAGTIWSAPAHSFEKVQGSVSAHWYPHSTGDDYAVQGQIRSGKTFGTAPFDELFMLGMERDNDLWMRAHVGTRDGQKGSAPLGRDYFLSNWEIDKRIYDSGLFNVKLSPFLDTGRITDPLPGLGAERWLWDTGVQVKLRVLGIGVTFVYGKDLRTGHNAFYATAQ